MIHTITLIILAILIMANIVILVNVSSNPMYNAMDNYNKTCDDTAEVLRSLREVVEDIQERLTILEGSYKYHIQSTDELKPKV